MTSHDQSSRPSRGIGFRGTGFRPVVGMMNPKNEDILQLATAAIWSMSVNSGDTSSGSNETEETWPIRASHVRHHFFMHEINGQLVK